MILQPCPASNYGQGLLAELLAKVDQTGCNYVQGAFMELARDLTQSGGGGGLSIATLMLASYVIFWGYGIWSGTATGTATDTAFRLFRAFMIYAFATTWSDFTAFIYTAANDGPAAIGTSLLRVGNNFSYDSPNAVVNAMQHIWDQIARGFQLHWTWSFQSLAAALVGLACVIIIALFLAICLFTIILSKVFLWLLLGLAPFVILLLLFNASSRFFSGWVNGIVLYVTLQILVYAFLAFYLTVTKSVFDTLDTALQSGQVSWATLAPFFIVGLTGIYLAHQLPALASNITGGVPIVAASVGGLWRGVASGVVNARVPGKIGERLGLNASIAERRERASTKRISGTPAAAALARKMDKV